MGLSSVLFLERMYAAIPSVIKSDAFAKYARTEYC